MPPLMEACNDLFEEGVKAGVKELFESYEDALLPIDVQLEKYKKRDLYHSHFHRTSCLVFGPRKHVRKTHIVDFNPFVMPTTKQSISDSGDLAVPTHDVEEQTSGRFQESSLPIKSDLSRYNKSWIQSRQKLRNDIDKMGLQATWLLHKPERSGLEERVLASLLQKRTKQPRKLSIPCDTNSSMKVMPSHISDTLEKFLYHIMVHNLQLSDIFSKCDQLRDIDYGLCSQGLEIMVNMGCIEEREAEEVLFFFYERNEPHSLYDILSQNLHRRRSGKKNKETDSLQYSEHHELSERKETVPSLQASFDSRAFSLSAIRRMRIREYQAAVKLCKEKGVPLTESLLRKVLLHPGDQPRAEGVTYRIRQPTDTLSKDFWKRKRTIARNRSKSERDLIRDLSIESNTTYGQLVYQLEKSGNRLPKILDGFSEETILSEISEIEMFDSSHHEQQLPKVSSTSSKPEANSSSSNDLYLSNSEEPAQDMSWRDEDLQRFIDSSSNFSEGSQRNSKLSLSSSIVLLPRKSDIAPERTQLNLSTGRAIVGRKVDCWLTYEDYERITRSLEPVIRRQRSFSNAFWPGHLLNKLRLCFASYETLYDKRRATSKNALFQVLSHTSQRSNHGYDNNERTWPSDGKYVKYGNIDQNKVYHL